MNFDGFEKINFNEDDQEGLNLAQNRVSSWKEFPQRLFNSKLDFTEENIKRAEESLERKDAEERARQKRIR